MEVEVVCSSPLIAVLTFHNNIQKELIDVERNRLLYSQTGKKLLVYSAKGISWEDIEWYEIQRGHGRLYYHQRLHLGEGVPNLPVDKVEKTFLDGMFSFEKVGPITLLKEPKRILWACNSSTEVHTLVANVDK